ncbi:MAG: RNA methyltransferase [Bacteroidota bacterium]
MTPERRAKFQRVVQHRQSNLTVVLENVHDPHNISAVLRSCDAVGVMEIYVLYTDTPVERLKMGKRSSSGAKKWVDVHLFQDVASCFKTVRSKYDQVLGTFLGTESKQLHALNLRKSTALVFGNEHRGLSEETKRFCDGNFLIPQVGMVESLNISVACAVTLYEAYRQRFIAGDPREIILDPDRQEALFKDYSERNKYSHPNS